MSQPRAGSDTSVYGHVENLVPEPEDWTNHPRTLTLGFFTFLWFLYAAFRETSDDLDPIYHAKRGIKYAALFFLVYCLAQLRDGHFIRPHPSVWRLVTGIFILYEMGLIVLLFQPKPLAKQLLGFLDPTVGYIESDRSYAEDCRIYTPEDPESSFRNVRDTFFDIFVPMHFLGWMIGALMVRNYLICWTISILFELYELTFSHWLVNFNECWWDHIFFDVLICNALGIYLGMQICRYFEMKKFNWVGVRQIPNLGGKARRVFSQLLPAEWLAYDWEIFKSVDRFFRVLFMIVALSVMMLNSFFLKSIFDVPPSSILNVYRLAIWYSAGSYAVAEYYIFCTIPNATKLGPRAWLGIGVVMTEICVILRHGKGYFDTPFPWIVKAVWGIVFVVSTISFTLYFGCRHRMSLNQKLLNKKTRLEQIKMEEVEYQTTNASRGRARQRNSTRRNKRID